MPFLAGVNSGVFSRVFGIDHAAMVEGGREILEQKGEVGQALFSAAAGMQNLRQVLEQFEQQAEALFKPSGRVPSINVACNQYVSLSKDISEASLSAKAWETQQGALERATHEIQTLQAELDRLRSREGALARIVRIRSTVARRADVLAKIEAMGSVIVVTADFSERRRKVIETLARANQALELAREAKRQYAADIDGLESPQSIIAESGQVKDLFQRLGEYRKAITDRPRLVGREQEARRQAIALQKGLRPDLTVEAIGRLRPDITIAKQPIQQLAQHHQAVESTLRKAQQDLSNIQVAVDALTAEVVRDGDGVDTTPLSVALKDARRPGDLDAQLDKALAIERRLELQSDTLLSALGLWKGTLEELGKLPVPSVETIERYEKLFADRDVQLRELTEEQKRLAATKTELNRAIEELQHGVAVPSEDDLQRTRHHRQQAWRLVRRAWLENANVNPDAHELDPERELPEAYEVLVVKSDNVADRLRREADRVASHAQSLAEQARLEKREELLLSQLSKLSANSSSLEAEWGGIWTALGIEPLPPREMRAWIGKQFNLRDHLGKLTEAKQRATELEQAAAAHRADLSARICALHVEPIQTDRLGPLLDQADTVMEAVQNRANRRRELDRLLAQHTSAADEVRRAEGETKQWHDQWTHAIRSLSVDAPPTEALAILDAYSRLFSHLDDAESLATRCADIDKDCLVFEQEVRHFADRVAPGLWDGDAVACVVALENQTSRAQQEQGRREALQKELRDAERRIAKHEAEQRSSQTELESLCREAMVERAEDLPAAETRSADFSALRADLHALETNLVEQGDGYALDDLVQQVEASATDKVSVELDRLRQRVTELEGLRTSASETRGFAQSELSRMTGSDAAAILASQAQGILAQLRKQVETYVRLRAASALLAREIERYRANNQDPLLLRAGEIFRVLTLARFDTVRSDVDDNDHPRLIGIRDSGKAVTVEGMSAGTRDQLYLSLRLATLERFLETAQPMPLIVDDILINFDDQRARATLDTLAELGKKTQVLVFTHHERVREMGKEIGTAMDV